MKNNPSIGIWAEFVLRLDFAIAKSSRKGCCRLFCDSAESQNNKINTKHLFSNSRELENKGLMDNSVGLVFISAGQNIHDHSVSAEVLLPGHKDRRIF